MSKMMRRKTWKEFMDCGLLWWVNRTLHLFGWAIACEVSDEGKVRGAFPARVKFRGFDKHTEEKGFKRVSGYLRKTAKELEKEARE